MFETSNDKCKYNIGDIVNGLLSLSSVPTPRPTNTPAPLPLFIKYLLTNFASVVP